MHINVRYAAILGAFAVAACEGQSSKEWAPSGRSMSEYAPDAPAPEGSASHASRSVALVQSSGQALTAGAPLATFATRAEFDAAGAVASTTDFEGYGTSFYYPPNPWTIGGVTYATGENIIVGTATPYAPPSAVLCYDYWSPMHGTIEPGHDMLGFDLGMIGAISPVTITLTTNQDTYTFPGLTIPAWTAGGAFAGFRAQNTGEYFTAFDISSATGGGSAPCVDNFAVGTAQPTYLLTLSFSGDATGSVAGTANGVAFEWDGCTATGCTKRLPVDASISLTETPDAAAVFTGWGIQCTGTAPTCAFTLNSDRTVLAMFWQSQYTMSVTMAGAGVGTVTSNAVNGNQIACTTGAPAGCSASFPRGSGVMLTPSYDSTRYVFQGWTGSGCSGTGPCAVSMTAARGVLATFAPAQYALTVTVAGSGSGTVTGPNGLSCTTGSTANCVALEPNGPSVTLTAVPTDASSIFKAWSGCASVSGNLCTVPMTSAKTVSATFEPAAYPLTVSFGGTGTGSVAGSAGGNAISWKSCTASACTADVANGASVSLTATAAAGSTFKGWGVVCSGTGACSFRMNSAKSPLATFSSP